MPLHETSNRHFNDCFDSKESGAMNSQLHAKVQRLPFRFRHMQPVHVWLCFCCPCGVTLPSRCLACESWRKLAMAQGQA